MTHATPSRIFLVACTALLLFNGCQTMSSRRNSLEEDALWTPAEWEPEPAVAEAPPGEEGEVEAEESADRPSLFARMFSRGSEEDADEDSAVQQAGGPVEEPPMGWAPPGVEMEEQDLPDAYELRVGDRLVVVLSGAGLNDQVEATVDNRGFIKLQYIGGVRAAGRTATELEREIEAEYTDRQQIFREVYATVHVPNRFYFIGGEVRQPGRYPLVGRVTLSQAVVAAGNFTEWARNDGRLTLVRNEERRTIRFRDITEDPSKDVELRTGDVITVDRRGF